MDTQHGRLENSKNTGKFKVEWALSEDGQVSEAINRSHAALGFTQVNPAQNLVLQKRILNIARSIKPKSVLDLYGGNGNLSKSIASELLVKTVCVDSFNEGKNPANVEWPNEKNRFCLVRARTEEFLRDQYWMDFLPTSPDLVIADPPRIGLGDAAELIAALRAKHIVIVCCDPGNLPRDLALFKKNYQVRASQWLTCFPKLFIASASFT